MSSKSNIEKTLYGEWDRTSTEWTEFWNNINESCKENTNKYHFIQVYYQCGWNCNQCKYWNKDLCTWT